MIILHDLQEKKVQQLSKKVSHGICVITTNKNAMVFVGAASAMTSIPEIPSKTVLPNNWGVPSGRHLQKAMENHRKCGKKINC